MNLYAKVLISLLATALAPLLLVTLITYRSSQETLLAMAGASLEASAQSLAGATVLLLEDAAEEVESWASLETLQNVFTGEDTLDLRMTLLLQSLQANSDFAEIWCTDAAGEIVAASNSGPDAVQMMSEEALRHALAGAPYVSAVTTFDGPDGTPRDAIAIAFPLYGAWDGTTLIGAIVGFYDWEQVIERVAFHERTAPEQGTHLFLADPGGRIVARGGAELPVVNLLPSELPRLSKAGTARAHGTSTEEIQGSRQIVAAASLQGKYAAIAYTGVAIAPEALVLQPARQLAWRTLLACACAAVAIVGLALLLSRRISRPLASLSATARQIADGNLDLSPPRQSGDEIGRLAADLDTMRLSLKRQIDTLDQAVRERTGQLEQSVRDMEREIQMREQAQQESLLREQQLRQADKMVSLGVLVSGVAHEINNPNGLIALNLGLLGEVWEKALPVLDRYQAEHGDFSLGPMNYSELRQQMPLLLADTTASSDRIRAIVDDLKGFSRQSDERLDESVDLNRVVESAANLVSSHLKKATRHFGLELCAHVPEIRGNGRRLEQVLVNLLLNACDALESSEQFIRVLTFTNEAGKPVIEVRDGGRGIPAEDLPRITDPFFTTRRTAGGTGLGLSVSAGIVEEHGGELVFESQWGAGTTARIVLPAGSRGEGP
ncbi:MAG TPA: hypothetical protein DDY86_10340 [Syntrophaceae bacterium]|nr:hypothetical protein [Syntrophaceae bacterium]